MTTNLTASLVKKVLTDSKVAGEDMSSSQYKLVALETDGTVDLCDAAADKAYGVLLNNPTSGQIAEIGLLGIYPVQANVALGEGDIIAPSTDGQAQVAVTTQYPCGHVVKPAGAAGELAMAFISPAVSII